MNPVTSSVSIIIGVVLLLFMTFGRVIFRYAPKRIDWALEVAFIRLEFPPEERLLAQQLAAGLAEIVGMKIKQLKPEHNLIQIAEWADNEIYAKDLITLFLVAFKVKCDPETTFRDLVKKVTSKQSERSAG